MANAFFVRGNHIPIYIAHIPTIGGFSNAKIIITVDSG